jgi:molecular chaperone DnaK (HSP70)
MHCPNCKIWEITEADVFCSWCRTRLVDFRVSFNLDHICAGDLSPEPVTLTLTHVGTVGSIQIEKIESSQSWLTPHLEQIADRTLQVGKDIVVPIDVDVLTLTDDYHEARVTLTSSMGTREATLEITPRPKFKVMTDGEYSVLLDNILDERMSGYLSVTRGVVTVESLTTDVSQWATVEAIQPSSLPCKLDQRADNRLEFIFHINEQYVLDEVQRESRSLPAEYKGTLLVKLTEFEEPRKEIFRVKCFLPPRLEIPEAETGTIRLEVFTGKRAELDLTLQNGDRDDVGRADLQIQEIKIDAPWLHPSGSITYPLVIGSGQYHGLTLSAATGALSEGVYPARITVLTNIPGADRQRDIHVDMKVCPMPEFEGEIAIDFGTTNCCCAFLNGGSVELVPIGDLADGSQTTVSSAILYLDLFEKAKEYEIGNRAYEISYEASTYSAIRQVKRRLGTNQAYDVTFQLDPAKRATYMPREVAADIMRRILDRAEERVKGRITSCTMSHPSRFSLRQIDDLKTALVACGIPRENIRTIHEPIGAALGFIQQEEIRKQFEQYSLMVFDFGGGTTDITLLSVKSDKLIQRQLTVITPEVLGATGDRWLGGEDVTDIVMKLALARCEDVLRARNPDALNIAIPFDAENFNDPRRRRLARENRNLLRFWAEAAKIAISTYGDEHQEALRRNPYIDGNMIKSRLPENLQLAVIVDNDVRPIEQFFHDEVVPRHEEINEQLRPRLEKIALMMQRLARNNQVEEPDIILLSGKSSGLPIVREVLSAQFPNAQIEQPSDLKDCVVRGACQFSSTDPRFGVYLNIEDSRALSATTSRLGLRVDEAGQLKFKELLDAGVPISEAGINVPVTGIVLKRDTQIRIMENTSLDDDVLMNGGPNPNMTELKVFRLAAKLAEWEKRNSKSVTDKDLFDAEIQLVVTSNLAVKLTARVPGIDEALEFEAEMSGW